METTEPDPIIAEVRAVRDGLTARAGYDVKTLFEHIRELEKESGRTYITYAPRRVREGTAESAASDGPTSI